MTALTDAALPHSRAELQLPSPRGALSEHVFEALRGDPATTALKSMPADHVEDEQVALFAMQQLSYRRIEGVDPAWEESSDLSALRNGLEAEMEARLRADVDLPDVEPAGVVEALTDMLSGGDGPSLSGWVESNGTVDHIRELLLHRAAYQLQEADPHSFALPRLDPGVCKTALLELQMDEYGGHEPSEAHSVLFAATMEAFGMKPVADIEALPAQTLVTCTLVNRLGRSRRLLPACLGHLAGFEMTSVEPMASYAATVRRLLPGPEGTTAARFYDVHVAADGFHATLAADRLIGGFVAEYPEEARELLFGAAALMAVEGALSDHILESWSAGTTSLRAPLEGSELSPRRSADTTGG